MPEFQAQFLGPRVTAVGQTQTLHAIPDVGEPRRAGPRVLVFPNGAALNIDPTATPAVLRDAATDYLRMGALRLAAADLLEKEEADKAARDPYRRLATAIAGSTLCICADDVDACDAHDALAELNVEMDRLRRAAANA